MELEAFNSLSKELLHSPSETAAARGLQLIEQFCDANQASFSFCDRGISLFVKEAFIEVRRQLIKFS
jgi:hypothetical protein